MKAWWKHTENKLFVVVLLIGTILRFYHFSEWSLSNDELSALKRLQFDNLSLLIQEGIRIDGHPAVTQLFLYYWTQLFGDAPFVLRLPFVIFGSLGLIFLYRMTSSWSGRKTALLVTAAASVISFYVLYAQIARPYALGFMMVCLFGMYWVQLVKESKYRPRIMIAFILSGAIGLMVHYFASLSIALLLLTGVLFCHAKDRLRYLFLCLGIGLLFLPHLPITLNQLSIGGVGGWLPPPESDFIWKFLQNASNESTLFQGLLMVALLIGFMQIIRARKWSKWDILPLFLFVIPYLIGYYYSINRNPVLQFSVLIFASPFLLLFIFAPFRHLKNTKLISFMVALLIVVGAYSMLVQQNFYQRQHFAEFKGVAEKSVAWSKELGTDSVLSFLNANSSFYFDYYFRQLGERPNFAVEEINSNEKIGEVIQHIQSSQLPYVMLAWSNAAIPYEIHEAAKKLFPHRIKHQHYFNAEISVYAKSEQARATSFLETLDLKAPSDNWQINLDKVQDSVPEWESPVYLLDSLQEFALTYRNPLSNIILDSNRFITVSVRTKSEELANLILVAEIKRGDEVLHWRGVDLKHIYRKGEWNEAFLVIEWDKEVKEGDQFATYLWNPDHHQSWVKDFSIAVYRDSDYNYYERP